MLTTLIRHVDKLDSAAQQKRIAGVRQQWRETYQRDIDASFAATGSERQAGLDRGRDRLMLIADLTAAFSPMGCACGSPGRSPRPTARRKIPGHRGLPLAMPSRWPTSDRPRRPILPHSKKKGP
jgi:hypothetical protein